MTDRLSGAGGAAHHAGPALLRAVVLLAAALCISRAVRLVVRLAGAGVDVRTAVLGQVFVPPLPAHVLTAPRAPAAVAAAAVLVEQEPRHTRGNQRSRHRVGLELLEGVRAQVLRDARSLTHVG